MYFNCHNQRFFLFPNDDIAKFEVKHTCFSAALSPSEMSAVTTSNRFFLNEALYNKEGNENFWWI